jgi:hypothetical protein
VIDAEVCYLLVQPSDETGLPSPPERVQRLKDAPYFEAVDLDIRTIARQAMDVGGVDVSLRRQVYDGRIEVVECMFALTDALSTAALETKERVVAALKARLMAASEDAAAHCEEYTLLLLTDVPDAPDSFVDGHGQALSRFIRAHGETFATREVRDILGSRVRYSDRTLTLVDWDGAVVIAPDGDFQSDIELLKIGNYQLLRYRLLDEAVERYLRAVSDHLQAASRPSLLPSPSQRILRQAVAERLSLTLDFEKIDQSLLLIGDWYTAKLYQVIYDELYLAEWKAVIKSKLDSLESVTAIIQANFTFSWRRVLDLSELTGWLVLLVGYFILFYLEWSRGH